MKQKPLLSYSLLSGLKLHKLKIIVLSVVAVFSMSFSMIYIPLPPADATGSPTDGMECTGCHADFALNTGAGVASIITSDIPVGGYTPLTTYSITVTLSHPTATRFQFELSPQDASGTYLGTLHAVAGNTALVGTKDIAGDAASLDVSGSNSWTFTWTAPATGLGPVTFYAAFNAADKDGTEAGDYIYTKTATVSESAGSPLAASMGTPADVTCFGSCNGSVAVTASGGTAPYTYSWSPSGGTTSAATALCATDYTVVVTDAAAASVTSTVTITEPAVLTATASVTSDVKCNGGNDGSAAVTAGGGTSTYTYLWSNGSPNPTAGLLTAGDYTATVSDAKGCSVSSTVTVTEPATALTATASVTSNVSCNGGNDGSAAVTAGGGTISYTYLWSNGSPNPTAGLLTAGDYTATVSDANGCSVTPTVTVTEPAILTATDSSTCAHSAQFDGTATVYPSGGTSPYSYLWNPTGQITQTATGLDVLSYTVTVTDNNNCSITAIDSVYLCVTSVAQNKVESNPNVYPNPNLGEFNIELNSALSNDYTIELSNMLGQVIYSESLTNFSGKYSKNFDVKQYGEGIYFMNIRSNEGQLMRKVVVY